MFSDVASANKTDYQNLPLETTDFIRDSFNSYNFIAVRDRFTIKMIQQVLLTPELDRNKYFRVIDPTFLIDSWQSKPVKNKLERKGFDPNKSTVIFNLENKRISHAAAKFFEQQVGKLLAL